MKWFFSALMIVTGASALAQQEEAPEFKYKIDLRARYYNVHMEAGADEPGSGYNGSQSFVAQRSLFGLQFRKGERLGGQLTLVHNANWGRTTTFDGDSTTNSKFGPNTGDTSQAVPDGVGNAENMVLINEARGWWKMSDSVSLNIGRFGFQVADGAVFARNDWEAVPTSFDGANLSWDMDRVVLNFFGAKLEELPRRSKTGVDANDPESNVYMVSADAKMLPESLSILNGHLIQLNSSQNVAPNLPSTDGAPTNSIIEGLGKNIQHLGFTVKGNWRALDYRTTAAYQQGKMYQKPSEEINVQAHMLDLEAGYTFAQFMKLRFFAGFHWDSGDSDTTDRKSTESSVGADNKWTRYSSFFYDKHKYGGFMDLIGWGNLTSYQIGLTSTPFENAEAGVQFVTFARSSEKDAVTAGTRGGELFKSFQPDPSHKDDKAIGQEVDLTGDYNFDGGFSAQLLVGVFFPGSYIKSGMNETSGTGADARLGENIRQVVLQGRYLF